MFESLLRAGLTDLVQFFCKMYFVWASWSRKKNLVQFFLLLPPQMAVFPQRGYLASQIARIEGTALNPGKVQCEEITFVFGGGTRLTTLLELRAVPSFLANCRTWKFSADVVWDDFIRITFVLPSILANCPQFRQSDEAPKNGQF